MNTFNFIMLAVSLLGLLMLIAGLLDCEPLNLFKIPGFQYMWVRGVYCLVCGLMIGIGGIGALP